MEKNTDLIYIDRNGNEYIILMYGTIDNDTCCLLQKNEKNVDFEDRKHIVCSKLYPFKKDMDIDEEFDNYEESITYYQERYLLD